MNTRRHGNYSHGLEPGTVRDINCPNCIREDSQPIPTAGPPGGTDRQWHDDCPRCTQCGDHRHAGECDPEALPTDHPYQEDFRQLSQDLRELPGFKAMREEDLPLSNLGKALDEDEPSWSDQAAEDEFIDSAMEYLRHENPTGTEPF